MAVNTARLKLDEVLGEIVDRFEGSVLDDDEDLKSLSRDGTIMPPPSTPTKRTTPRTPRKRRRKDLTSDNDFESTSRPRYTVTLFDRAVDLAQFDEDTQLYEMCRAWMINRPNLCYSQWKGSEGYTTNATMSSDGILTGVHSLPRPIKTEFTGPRPLPPACKTDKLEDIIDQGTDIQELKKENMARWRKVGGRWRDASFQSQQSHIASLKQLKKLFVQQPC